MASEKERREKRRKQSRDLQQHKASEPPFALPNDELDETRWLTDKAEQDEEDEDVGEVVFDEDLYNAIKATIQPQAAPSAVYAELQNNIEDTFDSIRADVARRLLAKLYPQTDEDEWLDWLLDLAYGLQPELIEKQIQQYRDLTQREDLLEVDRQSAQKHVRRLEGVFLPEGLEARKRVRKSKGVPF